MSELPLKLEKGHLYAQVGASWWLLDTGSPSSFGEADSIIAGRSFAIRPSLAELTADRLRSEGL